MARIGVWKFDTGSDPSEVTDSELGDGGAQDGSFYNGAATNGSGAGVFDGSDDYAEIPYESGFDLGTGSIAITFTQETASVGDLPYGTAAAQTLFSRDSTGFDNGGHLTIYIKSDGSVAVRHQDDDESFNFSGGSVTLGTPTTVVYSWGPTGSQLVVDGTVVDSGAEALTLAGNPQPIVIGASQAQSGDGTADNLKGFFDGEIDAIAMYDDPVGSDTVPCFTRGTMIQSPAAAVAIETLAVGDLVCTVHHGAQPIRWIGSRRVDLTFPADLSDKRRPVRITAGALGRGLPTRDLLVSRQHRMLVASKITDRMLNREQALVAAINLVGLPGIDLDPDVRSVEYFHMMFDRHEVIIAEGAPSESFYAGPWAMKAVTSKQRQEILEIFPQLQLEAHVIPCACPILPNPVQSRLITRHAKNKTQLLETFLM